MMAPHGRGDRSELPGWGWMDEYIMSESVLTWKPLRALVNKQGRVDEKRRESTKSTEKKKLERNKIESLS